MKKKVIVLLTFLVLPLLGLEAASGPYMATGIKIGEVTTDSAIIWMRLTANPDRVWEEGGMPEVEYLNEETGKFEASRGRPDSIPKVIYPQGKNVDTIEGAVPGAPGRVRVLYKKAGEANWRETGWQGVDPDKDFTRQIRLGGLQSNSAYQLRAESESGTVVEGRFQTAPKPDEEARILFTVSTCQGYPDKDSAEGFKIYQSMLKLNPQFYVNDGDILYYDQRAKTLPLALWHWQRMYSLPSLKEFHRQVSSYFLKDDHDTWMNDSWPGWETKFMGDFTFDQGLAVFREQVPMGDSTYRTVRWGKDLQVWFVEGRDFRSPNTMKDGPQKTIWGKEQMNWFMNTVQASDATFRVLVSPTPILGPDREKKKDNHSNDGFRYEGDIIRSFIASQKNMFIICGDRHWQYVSEHPESGIREYSAGPASNAHAGGFSQDLRTEMHRYLNITGGFLSVTIERQGNEVQAVMTHHDVDGGVNNRDILKAVDNSPASR